MRRKIGPSYLAHNQSGRGIAIWRDPTNTRRTRLLPGPFNSSESIAAFKKLQVELATSPTSNVERTDISVAEVFAAYLEYARNYYANADGSPSKELPAIKSAMNPADALYGDLNAAEFGPQKLKVVRQKMIESDWCRSLVNRRINCIRRVFKWAASEELIPVSTFEALRTLAGLRRGRTEARESAPVRPVDPVVVDSTLPYLLRELAQGGKSSRRERRRTPRRDGREVEGPFTGKTRDRTVAAGQRSRTARAMRARYRTVRADLLPESVSLALRFVPSRFDGSDADLHARRRAVRLRHASRFGKVDGDHCATVGAIVGRESRGRA